MDILLYGAVVMVGIALILAWMGTFARWFVIGGLDNAIDYGLLIKAHIDFILMSLFCLSFYSVAVSINIILPIIACWMVVLGGMTNSSIFIIAMLKSDFWEFKINRIYAALSFITTTIGFYMGKYCNFYENICITWLSCYPKCRAVQNIS